jgi:3-mercaptopyruvate sulfurtransferase SseA
MRSLILASALLMAAFLLAVGASHNIDTVAAERLPPTQTVQAQTGPTPADGVRRISVEELRAALEKGTVVVVDVRGEDQYRAGHIRGALWIPVDEIANRSKELPKEKLIVTYCS